MVKDGQEYSLEEKYRPESFDQIVGNENMIEGLKTVLSRPTGKPHTFLLSGPKGCGKTTLAGIIAKELGCNLNFDFFNYNISEMRGIDTAREIISRCNLSPMGGKCKVYVLNEVHKATNEWQNAMLDILEKPQMHVYFILVTTEPEKLLKTVRDRTVAYQVTTLTQMKIIGLLKSILEKEKVDWVSDKVLTEIAKSCEGGPRRAVKLLDQIIDLDTDEKMIQMIFDNSVSETTTLELCQALIKGKPWADVRTILNGLDIGKDAESIRYAILEYMCKVLLGNNANDRIADLISLFSESVMYSGRAGLVAQCYFACK